MYTQELWTSRLERRPFVMKSGVFGDKRLEYSNIQSVFLLDGRGYLSDDRLQIETDMAPDAMTVCNEI